MKARRICISERRNASGTISYKVEGRDEKNRRRRRFFSSKEDALAYRRSLLKALKTNGRLTLALSSKEILDAQAALQLLKGSGATLVAAVEYYCKHAKPVGGVKSLQEVCDECLAKKERAGKKPKYLKELRSKFRQFCRRFAERPINSLSVAEVDEWLHSNNFSRLTIGNYIRELGVLFSFAQRQGYVAENVLSRVEKPLPEPHKTGILTVSEAVLLLDGALAWKHTHPVDLVPYLTIGLFAGLRASEIEGLRWKNVDFEGHAIVVEAGNAKTGQRRNAYMPPNLRLWLEPYKASQREERVVPEHWRKSFKSFLYFVGFDSWVPNCLRHSFGSYHVALLKNASLTATALGHSSTHMTHKHYKELVRSRDAQAYFTIAPVAPSPTLQFADYFGRTDLLQWDNLEAQGDTREILSIVRELSQDVRVLKCQTASP